MPLTNKTCVSCGKVFALLPNKPGLVTTCPQCSAPTFESEIIVRKQGQKRSKTTNQLIAVVEGKIRRLRNNKRAIFGKKAN